MESVEDFLQLQDVDGGVAKVSRTDEDNKEPALAEWRLKEGDLEGPPGPEV